MVGQEVLRLLCGHMYHTSCYYEMTSRSQPNVMCPSCRGPACPMARWNFVDLTFRTQRFCDQCSALQAPPTEIYENTRERAAPTSTLASLPRAALTLPVLTRNEQERLEEQAENERHEEQDAARILHDQAMWHTIIGPSVDPERASTISRTL